MVSRAPSTSMKVDPARRRTCSSERSIPGIQVPPFRSRFTRVPQRMFVSDADSQGSVPGRTARQALQVVGNDAEAGITIRPFAGDGQPVLPGVTGRPAFASAPGHAADLARGDAMKNNRVRIVTGRPQSAVDLHPPTVNSGTKDSVAAEYLPAAAVAGRPMAAGSAPITARRGARGSARARSSSIPSRPREPSRLVPGARTASMPSTPEGTASRPGLPVGPVLAGRSASTGNIMLARGPSRGMADVREAVEVLAARPTLEGAGVRLRRAFGYDRGPAVRPVPDARRLPGATGRRTIWPAFPGTRTAGWRR